MNALKILITNHELTLRGGTELYVRDVACELLKRGHTPLVYSPTPGGVADEIRAQGISVVSNLAELGCVPDLIHGHHHLETVTALLQFPDVPVISFCHGTTPWIERPPIFARILRYVAVDMACRERLCESGVDEKKIEVVLNFVDLARFQPRAPLPVRPKRAVIFSNYARPNSFSDRIQEACEQLNLEVNVVGLGAKTATDRPEMVLGEYDLVFAKGRCALEAMAMGCGVIVCNTQGLAGMVTPANFSEWRALNFGLRTLTKQCSVENLISEIQDFDVENVRRVSDRVRAEAGLTQAVDQLLEIYQSVLEQWNAEPVRPSAEEERHYAAHYLRTLAQQITEFERVHHDVEKFRAEIKDLHELLTDIENSRLMRVRRAVLNLFGSRR